MKILFVTECLFPCKNASSSIILNIINELKRKNVISVISVENKNKFNTEKNFQIDGISICRCFIPSEYSIFRDKIKTSNHLNVLLHLLYNPKALFNLIQMKIFLKGKGNGNDNGIKFFARYVRKELRKKLNQEKFDIIFLVSLPFFINYSIIGINNKAKIILYQLDPYTTNQYTIENDFIIKKRLNLEMKVFAHADKIIVPKLTYESNQKCDLKKYNYKCEILEFPLIKLKNRINDDISVIKNKKDKINCLFSGTLYENIRNPLFLLELIIKLGNKYRFYFIGDGCARLIDMYSIKNNIEIYRIKWESPQVAFNSILDADILINIGNTISNQMPSKILDYISTGKPILNICKIKNCPTLEYTKKYPFCLNVYEGDGLTDEIVRKVNTFSSKNKGKRIAFDKIKKIYNECTSEYVSFRIEYIINELMLE